MTSGVDGNQAVPQEPDHSRIESPVERRQSRWATVLAVLQRVLYLVVTVAVGWAVWFFLLSRL
jgi:hypothetical protein